MSNSDISSEHIVVPALAQVVPQDLELARLSNQLDELARAEAEQMPVGMVDRVLARVPTPTVHAQSSGVKDGLRHQRLRKLVTRSAFALVAATLALFAIPYWQNWTNPQVTPAPLSGPGISLVAYDSAALELFELSTAALSAGDTQDAEALRMQTELFDPQITLEANSWFEDETDAL
jgi:hypothetical protein